MSLVEITSSGLYCSIGDFYIDPWRGVDRAVVTHAHSDHARRGSASYLAASEGVGILKYRLGPDIKVQGLRYGESVNIKGVRVSLHPAGHILGASMVRVEYQGIVWLISGDYKTQSDPTCSSIEPVKCHVFITESTFGLPIYRWQSPESVMADLHRWWQRNAELNCCSVVFGYSLGKAQRILASLNGDIGLIGVHGAIHALLPYYEESGVRFPKYELIETGNKEQLERFKQGGIIIAPPSANGSPWLAKFGEVTTASASGWMTIRGPKRRANVDAGFVLSDHADWPGLLDTIRATGAERIGVTHGYVPTIVRYLKELGLDAYPIETRFQGDASEE